MSKNEIEILVKIRDLEPGNFYKNNKDYGLPFLVIKKIIVYDTIYLKTLSKRILHEGCYILFEWEYEDFIKL